MGRPADPEECLREYEAALGTQDWDKIAPLIHTDCVAVFSSGTFVGKEEVEAAFRRPFQLIADEDYAISEVHWVEVSGTLAVCRYRFEWSGLIDGEPAAGGGRGTCIMKDSGKGWQILLEHLGP